ncbi:MAG: hypothetical protein K2X98_06645 [Alphaproteobacteria bacterium]|nr:hypothetical protein [Alphaproteobacteria bacterium]
MRIFSTLFIVFAFFSPTFAADEMELEKQYTTFSIHINGAKKGNIFSLAQQPSLETRALCANLNALPKEYDFFKPYKGIILEIGIEKNPTYEQTQAAYDQLKAALVAMDREMDDEIDGRLLEEIW